ncbi:phosphate:acyl-[acyl carrier protein] acyltransferase [Rhodothalassium salexigens DSM 2132]|uniref:Phosphate acyltransferase n=1 Tax=Rhodothalassium salexigens DSM 2132 TaxID=1188247 RepID=A0A4R2PVA3_RHOSA|nr:phosphate acyltransferase PlsX [Rhodothalassium salexigens]MBB4209976.1 glycerol-3-phosphate acyltransferase PlsX [Rhodothalassium salexigens DSM 2132]MBK1637652.1 phosphate acyltransferase [Rhodothalassium salexigens DSM 2132]TCP38141.1 phosphate:acyl-[acyl carrier protein] acyltransferase [Rhodothalassium salexigens DSM 2132]
MSDRLTIALDAMGGDAAPDIVVAGAERAREVYPDAGFLFFGRRAALEPLLAKRPTLAANAEIRHTDDVVSPDDRPSTAVRRGRKSSMGLALEAVRQGEAHAALSAGNTGALMAMAKVMLKTLPGIDRPALASFLPTYRGDSIMLDLGANVDCDSENLVQFAVMGAAFARTVLGLNTPSVGLLNIGEEELKGNDTIRRAAERLRRDDMAFDFAGFVEGDGIGQGQCDVVVTDGFTGNVALKTAEGTARLISRLLADAFRATLLAKLAYALAARSLGALKDHLDPNNHNGAVFLGLNGLVVKSHGGANAAGYAAAIGVAVDMARADLCRLIADDVARFKTKEGADTALQTQ